MVKVKKEFAYELQNTFNVTAVSVRLASLGRCKKTEIN